MSTGRKAETHGPRRRAVLVGVTRYTTRDDNLPYALPSARRLSATLAAYYEFEHIRLLKNEEATRSAIVQAIHEEADGLHGADGLVIALFGHGAQRARGQRWRFLPHDASTLDPYHTRVLTDSDLFRETLGELTVGHVLVIIDACYSGTLLSLPRGIALPDGSQVELSLSALMSPKKKSVFVMVSGADEVADGGGDGCSLYTQALCDILAEMAQEPMAPASAMAERIRLRVLQETRLSHCPQAPMHGHVAGDRGAVFCFHPLSLPRTNDVLCEAAAKAVSEGQIEEGIQLLSAATLVDRANEQSWTRLADLYQRMNERDAAEAATRNAIVAAPDSEAARCLRELDRIPSLIASQARRADTWLIDNGQICFDAGLLRSAIIYWAGAAKKNPHNAIAHAKLGYAYEYLGDPGSALKAFMRVLKIDAGRQHFLEKVRLMAFSGLMHEISAVFSTRSFREGLTHELKTVGEPMTEHATFNDAMQRGDALAAAELWRQSLLAYRCACTRTMDLTERLSALTRIGQGLSVIHEDDPARFIVEVLISAYPEQAGQFGWFYELGGLAYRAGQPFEAIAFLNAALEQVPDHVPALWIKGLSLRAIKCDDDACDCFSRILAVMPDFEHRYELETYLH